MNYILNTLFCCFLYTIFTHTMQNTLSRELKEKKPRFTEKDQILTTKLLYLKGHDDFKKYLDVIPIPQKSQIKTNKRILENNSKTNRASSAISNLLLMVKYSQSLTEFEKKEQEKTNSSEDLCLFPIIEDSDNKNLIFGIKNIDSYIRKLNISTRFKKILDGHAHEISALLLLHDKKTLISASVQREIKVWQNESEESTYTFFTDHQTPITNLVELDNRLIISTATNELKIWDLEGNCKNSLTTYVSANNIIAPDSNTLLIADDAQPLLEIVVLPGKYQRTTTNISNTRKVIGDLYYFDNDTVIVDNYPTIDIYDIKGVRHFQKVFEQGVTFDFLRKLEQSYQEELNSGKSGYVYQLIYEEFLRRYGKISKIFYLHCDNNSFDLLFAYL